MFSRPAFYFIAIILAVVILGCSAPDKSPILPAIKNSTLNDNPTSSQVLWGYFDVYLDLEKNTIEAVPNRTVMFEVNVNQFLNMNNANISFEIYGIPVGAGYIDVDLDVKLRHPFPGLDHYNGYDVRGVFIGNSSNSMAYNTNLKYAQNGVDQIMYDFDESAIDPYPGLVGMPDGYTRWFNPTEFTAQNMFGHIKGKLATPNYTATATLNPYKLFADGMSADQDAVDFVSSGTNNNVFSAGSTNARNYYLRFPTPDPNVKFNYAVVASWKGVNPSDHPANTPEVVAANAFITDNIFFTSPGNFGGKLIADITLAGYGEQPSNILIESTVLNSVKSFDASTIVIGGGENFSTYHVEIPVENVTGTTGNEFFVIAEYPNKNYKNDFGTPNSAGDDPFAAFFRFDLPVNDGGDNQPPICDVKVITPMPYVGFATCIEFDASGSSDPDGDPLTFEWDFNDDGNFGDPFDFGSPSNPRKIFNSNYVGDVCVRVSDGKGGVSECCVPVNITAYQTKNIDVTNGTSPGVDIAIDHTNGDVMIFYANKQVRRYKYNTYFGTFSTINASINANSQAKYIDVNPNGFWDAQQYEFDAGIHRLHKRIYNPSDAHVITTQTGVSGAVSVGILDVSFMQNVGNHANDIVFVYGIQYSSGNMETSARGEVDSGWINGNTLQYLWLPSDPIYAVNSLYYPNVVACEADINGDYLWFVEKGDNVATRWDFSSTAPWGPLPYSGPSFGTSGTGKDSDDGLNSPLDICSDKYAQMYVLDKLSDNSYVVKAFTYSSSAATPSGSFDSNWIYSPLRIDGSVYNGNIVVLMSDGSSTAFSMFTECELP